MKKLGVEWFSDQLVAHVKRGFKVNAYDILYYAEKAFEIQRDEFDQAICFGIDLEFGNKKRDYRFITNVDQFIYEIKNK